MVKIGIVGCGYWGPNLIRNFFQAKDSELCALCDTNEKRLKEMKETYFVKKSFTDYKSMLKDPEIEAVVIATPPKTHYSLVQEALSSNKHVLVEKPLAFNTKESKDLVELAKTKKRILMVGHTFEFNPAVIKMKECITSGELGKISYIYSTRVNLGRVQENINAIWSLAPHDVSIIHFILGSMPVRVRAYGSSHINKGIEDVVFINLEFKDNVMAHIHVSWLDPSKIRKMTVVGSKKMLIYDDIDNEGKIKIYDKGVDRFSLEDSSYGVYQTKLRAGDITMPKLRLYEPLRRECEHFIECIINNKNPDTDGENGLRVVSVLEAAQMSLEQDGKVVEIK
ncbi:Gfo/Idh/MocA family protein [Candidatus Omnitrophota bacterium]